MESERKVIGLYGCIALTLGNVIGSGIFTSPTEIMRGTSSIGMAMCVWLFVGLLSLTGGFTFAEITSTIPISGFGASFMKFSGFRSVAFMFANSQIFLIFPTVITLQTLTFAQHFMEACGIVVKDPKANFYVSSSIGICVLLLLLVLNSFVKFTHLMKVNIFMSGFKIATLFFIVILALVVGKRDNLARPFANSTLDPDRIVTSSYNAMFAFEGYDLICVGVEEVKNPARNLPLAITTSLLIVNLMYILVNFAFCLVVGPQKLIQMSATESLNYFSQQTLGQASFVMPLLISLCMLNSMNCTIFGGSRIIHVSAREELVPGWLSGWSATLRAPRTAFFFFITMAIIILLFLNLTTISDINALQNLTKWVQAATVTSLLLFIRVSRLKVKDSIIRVNILFPCLFLACLIGFIFSTLFTSWPQIVLMVGFFGTALSVYFVMVRPTGIRRYEKVEKCFDFLGATFTRYTERLFQTTADRQPARPRLRLRRKLQF